jgi:hypothetical protein
MTLSRFILGFIALTAAQFSIAADAIFREPFTLRLHVDKDTYYEEEITKVPYVHDDVIYLFKGDTFGVNVSLTDGTITKLSYVPPAEKSDLTFEFRQEPTRDGVQMMFLKITNNTKALIYMNAAMTVPGRKEILKTSIVPLEPGHTGFESWPHPIVQLALLRLRTTP